jgi:tetratricopeptide (TPR) repeat protein
VFGQLLAYQGRGAEAIATAERAKRLDPASAVTGYSAVVVYWYLRRFNEGLADCRRILDLDATMAMTLGLQSLFLSFLERHHEAVEAAEQALTLLNRESGALAYAAQVCARAGLREQALGHLRELRARAADQYVSPLTFANIAVALGDREQTFEYLTKAIDERTPLLIGLGVSPLYDSLRGLPRYESLLRQVGVKTIP